jgi:hypothetical protein
MKHLNLLSIAAIAFALTLNGCTVGPDYVQPDTEEPDAWHTAAVEGLEDGEATLQTWWQVFDDEKLSELVLRSAEGNLDLRSALWRVEEARALRGVVSSVGKPQVGFSADANRSLPSENGTLGDFAPEEGFEAEGIRSRKSLHCGGWSLLGARCLRPRSSPGRGGRRGDSGFNRGLP